MARTRRRSSRRRTRRGSRRGFASFGLGGLTPPNALKAVAGTIAGIVAGEYAIGSAFLSDWNVGWRRVGALAALSVGAWMIGKRISRPIAGGIATGLLTSAGLSAYAILRGDAGGNAPGVSGLGDYGLGLIDPALLEAASNGGELGDMADESAALELAMAGGGVGF